MKWFNKMLALLGFEVRRISKFRPALREFIYLDEVSLRSLLSSQKGHLEEGSTRQVANTIGAENTSTGNVGVPNVASLSNATRFQTSNSITLQTSSKATSQSWFREFHNMVGLRLIEPQDNVREFNETVDIEKCGNRSVSVRASELDRGELVEFRVRLTGDPVYHLSTLASEFTGMANDADELFSAVDSMNALKELLPVNKILQRLLAGLIPIRATALDYVAVKVGDTEYMVHANAIKNLNVAVQTIELVGVTELLAYWKDIRRVIFSNSEFTMLCRISRAGLHETWTPIKLADLFQKVAPQLNAQISASGALAFSGIGTAKAENQNLTKMTEALRAFSRFVLDGWKIQPTEVQHQGIEQRIIELQSEFSSVSAQKSAFLQLKFKLERDFERKLDLPEYATIRDQARKAAMLPLFPSLTSNENSNQTTTLEETTEKLPRLMDVEVIAIYW
jgi:hypothetical protein